MEDSDATADPRALPLADPPSEASRIIDAATAASVPLRLTGGLAVAARCPSTSTGLLRRNYVDIDIVGLRRDRAAISELMQSVGYLPDAEFNGLHGDTRLYFWDTANDRHTDVFLDVVEMCHKIDLRDRLTIDDRTLSLADLLLTKLQIFETNHKDFVDILALLVDQQLTDDERGINVSYIAELASSDWGLWRTITMVAERADQFAGELDGFEARGHVHRQVTTFLETLAAKSKSRGWKMRARIGERKRWYELPDEIR